MNDPSIEAAVIPESPEQGPAVLDPAALDRLRELDPDGQHGVLPRVLATYVSSLERIQVQLRDRMAVGDLPGAGALAHTLKSSSASVGALELSERCVRLERAARSGQPEALEGLATAVLEESSRVETAVRAMLGA